MSSGRQSETPVNLDELERILPALAGPSPIATGAGRFLETGIKVIDVMCPLVAGGTLAIAADRGAGLAVVMEELVRRVSPGRDRLTMFT
jgi:F0F1-type ATP synthase beta subunit